MLPNPKAGFDGIVVRCQVLECEPPGGLVFSRLGPVSRRHEKRHSASAWSSSVSLALDLEGVRLRITLRLLLNQLGLAYKVEDGLLTIGNKP